jgi:hypothetical protein
MGLSKGCTIGLIVLAVVVFIVILAVILVWVYKDKIVEAGIDYMIDTAEKEIVKDLPEGYTAEMVHQIMVDLKAGIKSGEIDDNEKKELAFAFQPAMADKKIDREEGENLLIIIQRALGREPVVPEEMPDEAMPDTLESVPDTM